MENRLDKIDTSTDLGSIRIADEVVAIISGLAAVEVEGVAGHEAVDGGVPALQRCWARKSG